MKMINLTTKFLYADKSALESVSDFVLAPLRYALNGRTVCCLDKATRQQATSRHSEIEFIVSRKSNGLLHVIKRIIAAAIAIILSPITAAGLIAKACSYSNELAARFAKRTHTCEISGTGRSLPTITSSLASTINTQLDSPPTLGDEQESRPKEMESTQPQAARHAGTSGIKQDSDEEESNIILVDSQEQPESPPTSAEPIASLIQQETDNDQDLDSDEVLDKKEFIEEFVSSFLHDYITGKITEQTDPENRTPMIELLLDKMPELSEEEKIEVEEMALNAYLKAAALGLYTNQQKTKEKAPSEITPQSPCFVYLIYALKNALPIDFPNKKISLKKLIHKAKKALKAVTLERLQGQLAALDVHAAGEEDGSVRDRNKLELINRLRESGSLFINEIEDP